MTTLPASSLTSLAVEGEPTVDVINTAPALKTAILNLADAQNAVGKYGDAFIRELFFGNKAVPQTPEGIADACDRIAAFGAALTNAANVIGNTLEVSPKIHMQFGSQQVNAQQAFRIMFKGDAVARRDIVKYVKSHAR